MIEHPMITLDGIVDALRAAGTQAWVGRIGGNVQAVHVGRRTLTLDEGQAVTNAPAKLDVWYHAAREGESDMPTTSTHISSPDEAVLFLAALPLSPEELVEAELAELRRTETMVERAILGNFLIAALWADATGVDGEEVDTNEFGEDDVQADDRTWVKVRTMIRAFLAELYDRSNKDDEAARVAYVLVTENPEQAGHDLWLTMRRHGTGFWDRGYGPAGDRLTELAHQCGTEDAAITVTIEHDGARIPRLDYP